MLFIQRLTHPWISSDVGSESDSCWRGFGEVNHPQTRKARMGFQKEGWKLFLNSLSHKHLCSFIINSKNACCFFKFLQIRPWERDGRGPRRSSEVCLGRIFAMRSCFYRRRRPYLVCIQSAASLKRDYSSSCTVISAGTKVMTLI